MPLNFFVCLRLPIHSAVAGGNLKLLIWLVDVHHCPLKMTNTNNRHKQSTLQLIKTSSGRTVLDIAIEDKKVDILQYLVNEKRVPMSSDNKKNAQALSALEAVLKAMPESPRYMDKNKFRSINNNNTSYSRRKLQTVNPKCNNLYNMDDENDEADCSSIYDSDDDESETDIDGMKKEEAESVATTVKDPCIICYERSIDCVLTPCGHQICCLHCSKNMTKCPICSTDCKSIRIFRP